RGPTADMFDYLGPEMSFAPRLVMANRWLLGGILTGRFGTTPQGNALLRTTTAPTVLQAGVKENVLPSTARALVNFRILPGDSVEIGRASCRERVEVSAGGGGVQGKRES